MGRLVLRDNAHVMTNIASQGNSYISGSSAKLGIGTSSPSKELTVKGDISASGDIITLGSGSFGFIQGRLFTTGSSNTAAVNTTMTEANYPGGSVIGLDMDSNTNDIQYTLPALTSGLRYTFIVNTNAGTGVTLTITSPSAGNLAGIAVCRDGNERILGDDFVIAAAKAAKGDRMELISDGNIWHITAFCSGSITDVSST